MKTFLFNCLHRAERDFEVFTRACIVNAIKKNSLQNECELEHTDLSEWFFYDLSFCERLIVALRMCWIIGRVSFWRLANFWI